MKYLIKSLTLLFSAAAMLGTTGCVSVFTAFDHNDNYIAGDFTTESTVKALDIDWVSGSVTVTHHDQPALTVTEVCNASLKDSEKLQTWLDGSTLHIRFSKPGLSLNLGKAKKNLEIRLPEGLELDTLQCGCTSADASLTDISAGSFDVDMTSGNLQLIGCSAETFGIGSTSGDITIEQKGTSDMLKAASTSGKINITAETVRELKTHTTSGDMNVTAQKSDSVSSSSVSGAEALHFGEVPASVKVDSTSGRVSLFVPKNADFAASVDTVSGKFDSELSLKKNGKTYTAGSGANQLEIDTTSGDVKICTED